VPDENVGAVVDEMRENDLVGTFLAGGFRVPAKGDSLREQFVQGSFHPFRAGAILTDLAAFTLGTDRRHLTGVTAGVAEQFHPVLMPGERQVAAWTAQGITAVPAEDIGAAAAPVEEENRLLIFLQHFA